MTDLCSVRVVWRVILLASTHSLSYLLTYTSLEGTEGNSREGNYGMLLYALAERRCIDFKTCRCSGTSIRTY